MPRQPRKPSGTGIYHVMLRGINRQDIFEDQEDYVCFLTFMQQMLEPLDDLGYRQPPLCTFYAYCLMSNHVHLLIKIHHEDIGATIKHLAVVYAMYFNHKYSRAGHLFQDRFKSEPVNDMAYFTTLLRYIHQNPVKAGVVTQVKDYKYSSWGEYDGSVEPVFQICNTQAVLNRIPFNNLNEWVNDPLPDDANFLDNDLEQPRLRISDDQAWQHIIRITGVSNSSEFQKLDRAAQRQAFIQLKELGASIRQLQRLTGIDRGIIQRAR
jgi:REP element-mobilizing transposase RayT